MKIDGRHYSASAVLSVLASRLSERRLARLKRVVEARTFNLVPVLEGLSDPGNVNAVLRSAEGLGCGAAHLVALEGNATGMADKYVEGCEVEVLSDDRRAETRVSQGAEKWMHVKKFASVKHYVDWAREQGYRLVATALHENAVPIVAVDFAPPTALVIGNERDGISETMLGMADVVTCLPVDGFVQSYNASVAAALGLYQARLDRVARLGRHADLSEQEREVLLAHYVVYAVNHSAAILRRELGSGTK